MVSGGVLRCPSCGRAWDAVLCMACGHEAVPSPPLKLVTEDSSSMPRAVAAPFGPFGSGPAPAASPFGPPAQPSPSQAAQSQSQSPMAVAQPTFPPPQAPSQRSPTEAKKPPSGPVRTATPTTQQMAVANGVDDIDVPAPFDKLPLPPAVQVKVANLWASPAAFGLTFGIGFMFAFALAAMVSWRGHDPQKLLAEGRVDDALTVIAANPSPPASWHLVKGHALHDRNDIRGMLLAYQDATRGGAADALGLEHVMTALGNTSGDIASVAVKTIEDWPSEDVDDRLLKATSDLLALRRNGALEALRKRPSATPLMKLNGEVKHAVANVNSEDCQAKLDGMKTLLRLASNKEAYPQLRASRAFDAVTSITSAVITQLRCSKLFDEKFVRETDTALSLASEQR